jgi:hypothetical protein
MTMITRYPVDVDLSKSSDTIDIQSQSVGALAANFFPALDTYASTIFDVSGTRFLKATDSGAASGPWTAKTKHIALDAEVTTMTRSGAVVLRYANNQGLFMSWSQGPAQVNGGLLIGHCVGLDETQPSHLPNGQLAFDSNPDNAIIYNSDLTTTHGVVGDNYATDTFTFGVSGVDLYVKYNGVTLNIPQLKGAAWRWMKPGKILFGARFLTPDAPGVAGFKNISISYPAKPSNRRSNFKGNVIDLTDYGIKALETTGSISASSNSLTVASAAGFAVGDQIIVAVGGETALSSIYSNTAAAGRRGTIGVGGSWPPAARLYATEAALLAASPADESYGETGTGRVRLRSGGTWQAYETGYYYWNMICPHALVAKITAIAGNVLTLDKHAVATTANAQVCFDCLPCFKAMTDEVSPNLRSPEVYIPATSANSAFHLSGSVNTSNHTGLKLRGHTRDTTKLKTPKGIQSGCFNSQNANDIVVSDFWYVSNHDAHGYGAYQRGGIGVGFNIQGNNFDYATGCRMERLRASEVPTQAFGSRTTNGLVIDNCLSELLVAPQQCYLQWNFNVANATAPIVSNCVSNNNWLTPSFEPFSCQDPVFRNCGGRNVMFSSNSCDGAFFDEIYADIEPNCRARNVATPVLDQNILQFNNNIGNSSGGSNGIPGAGGRIRNPRIVIQGYMDENNWLSQAINVSSTPNVLIEGTYNPLVRDDGLRKGLIQSPTPIASGLVPPEQGGVWARDGAKIISDAPNVTVRNMRVVCTSVTPNGGAVAQPQPGTNNHIQIGSTNSATISDIASLGTGTGSVTFSTLDGWLNAGEILVGSERMEYTVTNRPSRTVSITSRGFAGTTAVTHTNGATASFVNYPRAENCIADVRNVPGIAAVQTGNITNAAYAAL